MTARQIIDGLVEYQIERLTSHKWFTLPEFIENAIVYFLRDTAKRYKEKLDENI